jgi:hypothetical protein
VIVIAIVKQVDIVRGLHTLFDVMVAGAGLGDHFPMLLVDWVQQPAD